MFVVPVYVKVVVGLTSALMMRMVLYVQIVAGMYYVSAISLRRNFIGWRIK